MTGLVLTAAILPGALAASQAPAAASQDGVTTTAGLASTAGTVQAAQVSQASPAPVSIEVTGLSPQWASPGQTVTVSGTVTNNTQQAVSDLTVQLWGSSEPITTLSALQADLTSTVQLGGNQLVGRTQQPAQNLPAGKSSSWRISVPATTLGATAFGVYPLTAEVESVYGADYANTFLPYLPPKRGHRSAGPAPQQIAWVWPLIDQPLTGLSARSDCVSAAGHALAASMTGGRLGQLLQAGQDFATRDQLTWVVDPALLWDARQLGKCSAITPGQASAATDWLARLRTVTARQPLDITPFANVSLALLHQGRQTDVQNAYRLGQQEATQIMQRTATSAGSAGQPTAIAWPSGGNLGYTALEPLAARGVQTVLLSDTAVSGGAGSAFLVADGVGGYVRVLLYSDAITGLLNSATAAPASTFGVEQGFLAETAVLAAQSPGVPIVVAPPQDWKAPPDLAQAVLAESATAPWLKPVALSAVAAAAKSKDLTLPPTGPAGFSHVVLRQLRIVDHDITELTSIQAYPSATLSLALAALESSSWRSLPKSAQLARLAALGRYVNGQRDDVSIAVDSRVTLGGLKGIVPVVISNQLGYAVKVKVAPSYNQPVGGGVQVQQSPLGLVTVRAHNQLVTKLHVQATQVGSVAISLRLLNRDGQPLLSPPVTVTVQATQFGNLAMIILAAVLGLFTIASAARAIRRRPPPPDEFPGDGQGGPDGPHLGQYGAEPDSVVPERSELGAAGKSGL